VFDEVGYDARSGQTPVDALTRWQGQDATALVIQQPNFFGVLEDVDALTDWGHRNGALVVAVVNPTSLAVLKPPGEWGEHGVDIVVGDGQPLGVPLASGGPYVGFMTARMEHVRQMPGRIVGRTVDLDGKPGYTLTLQAREQHIRRSKATSNICTNQGLLMTAATIYLSLLGPQGLERVAAASIARTAELVAALTQIQGVRAAFGGARFHEALLTLDVPVSPVLEQLARRGIAGGFDASKDYAELGNALLVCATETKTSEDIAVYAAALGEALRATRAA
jgi:glycine dehydrogenase subunit 1